MVFILSGPSGRQPSSPFPFLLTSFSNQSPKMNSAGELSTESQIHREKRDHHGFLIAFLLRQPFLYRGWEEENQAEYFWYSILPNLLVYQLYNLMFLFSVTSLGFIICILNSLQSFTNVLSLHIKGRTFNSIYHNPTPPPSVLFYFLFLHVINPTIHCC